MREAGGDGNTYINKQVLPQAPSPTMTSFLRISAMATRWCYGGGIKSWGKDQEIDQTVGCSFGWARSASVVKLERAMVRALIVEREEGLRMEREKAVSIDDRTGRAEFWGGDQKG